MSALQSCSEIVGALSIVLKTIDSIEKIRANKDDALRLVQITKESLEQIADVIQKNKIPQLQWKTHLVGLTRILRDIQISCRKMASKRWLRRWFHKKANTEQIQRHWEALSNAQLAFQTAAHMRMQGDLAVIYHKLDRRNGINVDAYLQMLAPGTNGQWTAPDAPTGCAKSTREKVIASVEDWLDSSIINNQQRIFALVGPLGFGKSAIARSVCDVLVQLK